MKDEEKDKPIKKMVSRPYPPIKYIPLPKELREISPNAVWIRIKDEEDNER